MSEFRELAGQVFRPYTKTTGAAATAVKAFISNRPVPTINGIGTASAGSTTTLVCAALGATDTWAGRKVRFLSGLNKGVVARIIFYNTGTTTATFYETLANAVVNTDTFEMVPDGGSQRRVAILGVFMESGNNAAVEQFDLVVIQRGVEQLRHTIRHAGPTLPTSNPIVFPMGPSDADEVLVQFDKNGTNWASANRFWLQFTVL